MNKICTFAVGAAAGCAFGALAALALAPQSGVETRAIVVEKAGSLLGGAEAVKGAGGNQASVDTDEELRAKIEAARKRIAEQAAKNAEAAAE